jgi:hypothetical protein
LSGVRPAGKFMIEPNSIPGKRVRRLFRQAQELIRKQGIATPHGV